MTYVIAPVTADDVVNLLIMSQMFFEESNNSKLLTFSVENLYNTLTEQWQNPDFKTLLVKQDGKLCGYAHIDRQANFTVEPVGEVFQFFIMPEHRGKGASRILVAAIDEQFKVWGCPISYAECGCGFQDDKNDKLFFNLWKKFGYSFLGTALYKEHK